MARLPALCIGEAINEKLPLLGNKHMLWHTSWLEIQHFITILKPLPSRIVGGWNFLSYVRSVASLWLLICAWGKFINNFIYLHKFTLEKKCLSKPSLLTYMHKCSCTGSCFFSQHWVLLSGLPLYFLGLSL
jgi:hypothetical protein